MAETFGQHPNANVIFLTKENREFCETLAYLREEFNEPFDNNDNENKVLIQLSQILRNIPTLINYKTTVDNMENRRHILDFILLQEVLFDIDIVFIQYSYN